MFLTLFLLLLIPVPVQAEIFYWFDNNGQKHYSDRARQGAESLRVQAGYNYVRVKKVHDGDTILLFNGKKVRLLGINTPEVESRHKTLQAGGEEARQWLSKKVLNQKVRLESDIEKTDKYGRFLAHVFTEKQEHINVELVKLGYASVNIHPPNLNYTDKLLQAQQLAETQSLGLWGYSDYQPIKVSQITKSRYKGWQRVVGQIKKIRETRKYSYLAFNDKFALKVERKAQSLFPDLNSYIDQKVEVRGWISKSKKRYSMFIRHPGAIKRLD